MKPLVYIAAPYSHGDPVENTHNVIKAADGLLDVCVPLVPHLTMFWHVVSPKPYEQWLEIDREYLRRCDVVYRLTSGLPSSGADSECEFARDLGKPIAFSEEALRDWINMRWRP